MLSIPTETATASLTREEKSEGTSSAVNSYAAERNQGSLLLKALVIIFAGLLVFSPAINGDWLWDDDQEISANPLLPDSGGLIKIWTGADSVDYFPLKATVQWILWRFIKYQQTGYHLTNIALHLFCACLVWQVLWRIGVRYAWIGGLIFAIHPLAIESVAWISELKNTLSLPFILLSLLAWLRFDRNKSAFCYWSSVALFLAASLCKTSVVMFPFVILLYDWWKRSKLRKIDFARSIPFFAAALALGVITIYFQHGRAIGSEVIPVGGLASRFAIAGLAVPFYLFKTIFPFRLIPIYPRWNLDPPSLVQFLPWLGLLILLLWLWNKRNTWGRHCLFGLGFFLINLFPVLGFIKMSYMRITWVADHFVYLPMVGIIGLMTAGASELYDRSSNSGKQWWLRIGILILSISVVGGYRYAGIFSNEGAMWSYTLKYNPDAWQAHSRYGRVKLDENANDAAFYHIGEAVRLRPDLAETHNNYGSALESQGKLDLAINELRKAVKISPDFPVYKANLGSLLVKAQRYEEAREVYQSLISKGLKNPTILNNYGATLFLLGENKDAVDTFKLALKIRPDFGEAERNLEEALSKEAELEKTASILRNPAPLPRERPGSLDSTVPFSLLETSP